MIAMIMLTVSLSLLPDSLPARDSVSPLATPPWIEAAVTANTEVFRSRLSAWQWHTAALRYRGKTASHAAEAFVVRRFDRSNAGFALEEAASLGKQTYISGRAHFAPGAEIVARSDISATLYRQLGNGWEAVPTVRVMSFPNEWVRIFGLGAGRYTGLWYLAGRLTEARQHGERALTSAAQARRYSADGSPNFVDATISTGREVVVRGPSVAELERTSALALRGQRMFSRQIGLSLAATYDAMEALPDRYGAGLSLFVRW